ncbi:MAG: hypothetical protein QOE57_1214 [Acidimicrobiaceae bacterium]|nr:hypothetical protein [Acidimicrobiaceae bacterium]
MIKWRKRFFEKGIGDCRVVSELAAANVDQNAIDLPLRKFVGRHRRDLQGGAMVHPVSLRGAAGRDGFRGRRGVEVMSQCPTVTIYEIPTEMYVPRVAFHIRNSRSSAVGVGRWRLSPTPPVLTPGWLSPPYWALVEGGFSSDGRDGAR